MANKRELFASTELLADCLQYTIKSSRMRTTKEKHVVQIYQPGMPGPVKDLV